MKKSIFLLGGLFLALTAFVGTNNQEKKFQAFLADIETVALPYQVKLEDLGFIAEEGQSFYDKVGDDYYQKMAKYKSFIPELISGSFSRMGPPAIELLAKMEVSEEVVGVIYASHHSFYQQGASYHLMLYNRKGELLNYETKAVKKRKKRKKKQFFFESDIPPSFLLAYQGLEETQTATIETDGQIRIHKMLNNWEKDVDEYGFMENEIVGYQEVKEEWFRLEEKGKINSVPIPIAKDARAAVK
jgi:hypothetical protein